MSVNLGDQKDADGLYPCQVKRHSFIRTSDDAVQSSLSRLRPLTFSAAFKVQDMIGEWVLHANGSNAWPFTKKLKAYDDFRKAGTFIEPNTFLSWPDLSNAFWELYRELVPFRGTVVHGSGISVGSNGTLYIAKSKQLSEAQQGAYVRAMCLLVPHLLNDRPLSGLHEAIVANDFATLHPIHKQSGFSLRPYRFDSMHVTVPENRPKRCWLFGLLSRLIRSSNPVAIKIDFDDLKTQMEHASPVPLSGVSLFELSIQVEACNRVLLWKFPPDSIPVGQLMLKEGDAATDRYLSIKSK